MFDDIFHDLYQNFLFWRDDKVNKKVFNFCNATNQRNWVFVTNSDFLIPLSLHFNVGDLRNFKISIILDQIMKIDLIWNIKGLHHQIAKI